jgi:hypothetical protein
MDIAVITNNILRATDALGQVDVSGVKLENADPSLLDISEHDINRHVAIQPAAIAFFGMVRKEAHRRLAAFTRVNDRWEKKMYAQAKAAVMSGASQTYKPTVADVEARFVIDNEKEIEAREKQMEKLQESVDSLDSFYEAWRQKSFSIREWIGITEDERYNSDPSITTGGHEDRSGRTEGHSGASGGERKGGSTADLNRDRIERVREMMRKRKAEKELTAQGRQG